MLQLRKNFAFTPMNIPSSISTLWAKADRPSVRAFFLSIVALSIALLLALYSGAAAQLGNVALASSSALAALLVAGWVGITLVPVLAKRTPLRWIGYRMDYKITREGWIYLTGIVLIALAALNTGNNLLFLILASLIASILMSGILSSITLAGVELRLELPDHIFAAQSVRATVALENEKISMPSFSLRVEGAKKSGKNKKSALPEPVAMLETPVFFPYIPRHEAIKQAVPLLFPRRGVYRQEAFRIVTRFPFGFLEKARRIDLPTEAVVYPSVEGSAEFLDALPGIQGALESFSRGHGQDLYALRTYLPMDSVRHVHWKASARSGSLMVREFAREEDARVLLVFDPYSPAALPNATAAEKDRFERAVTLCAALAWDFFQRDALLEYRSAAAQTALAPASQNIFPILRHLALLQPLAPCSEQNLLSQLAADSESFKIIVTSQSHGAIPASLWNSSYILFVDDLQTRS
jgi:uncharacterized protein (DUF58 family)